MKSRGRRSGASSEQMRTLTEQLCLFNEAEALVDDKPAEPELEQITRKRRKQAGKREMDLSRLPNTQNCPLTFLLKNGKIKCYMPKGGEPIPLQFKTSIAFSNEKCKSQL